MSVPKDQRKPSTMDFLKCSIDIEVRVLAFCKNQIPKRYTFLSRQSVVRCRRKLKSFKRKLERGEMRFESIVESFESWLAYAKSFLSFKSRSKMANIFNNLYYTKGRMNYGLL